jgi:hypothetical protein
MTEKASEAKKGKGNTKVAGSSKNADKGLTLSDLAGGMTVIVDSNTKKVAPLNDDKRHPDPIIAATVATMSLAGFNQKQMMDALRMSHDTLTTHYQYEIDNGRVNTMTQVVQSLAQRAIAGSDTAAIFLAKARLGWSDRQQVELTGKDGGPIEIQQRTEILTGLAGLLERGITIDMEPEKKEGAEAP